MSRIRINNLKTSKVSTTHRKWTKNVNLQYFGLSDRNNYSHILQKNRNHFTKYFLVLTNAQANILWWYNYVINSLKKEGQKVNVTKTLQFSCYWCISLGLEPVLECYELTSRAARSNHAQLGTRQYNYKYFFGLEPVLGCSRGCSQLTNWVARSNQVQLGSRQYKYIFLYFFGVGTSFGP